MKEDGKVHKALIKVANTRIGYKLIVFIDWIIWEFKRAKTYFKKSAEFKIETISWKHDDGLRRNAPDGFNIYVCHKNVCHSLFGTASWDSLDSVEDTLKQATKGVVISMRMGMGSTDIDIPQWAVQPLLSQIAEVKAKYGENEKLYKEWLDAHG